MKKITTVLVLTLCISLIFVNQSFANGVLRDSMGATSGGRGGANIAHTDNGVLIFDNPSALTEMKGKTVEVDFDFLNIPMSYKDPQNDEDGDDANSFIPSVSYVQELPQGPYSVGIGVFGPAGFSTDYDLDHPFPLYGEQKYSSDASLMKILVGFGWRVNDEVSLGISAGPSNSKVAFEMPYTFQTHPLLIGTPILADLDGEAWGFAWNIGAQWRMSPNTTLGVSYHAPDKFKMEGDCDVDVPFLGETASYDVDFDFTWPQSFGVGMTHRLNDVHKFSADVVWIDWSSAFDDLDLELTDGDNDTINTMIGNKDYIDDTHPLDWDDSYAFRVGYEYLLSVEDTLRFGYLYNSNPVPDSTLMPVIPGIFEHTVSVGYGRNWKNWTFDAAGQYYFSTKQSVDESDIETPLLPWGGGDYDDSEVEVSGYVLRLGVKYHF